MCKKLFINAVLLSLVLSACNTTYHYSEFIKPSKVYIPSKIYAVGVLNRGASNDMATAIYTNGVPFEYIKGIPKKAAANTVDALESEVENLKRFALIDIPWKESLRDKRKFVEEPLTPEQIDSLCTVYNVAAIIALEGVEFTIRTQGNVNVVNATDQLGRPVRVPQFEQNQEASYTVAWRFYDGYSLKPIDSYQETYKRFFNKVSYDANAAAEVNPQDMQLMAVAKVAAEDYLTRISPHWAEDFRMYYRGGSYELYQISRDLEYNGNWEQAATNWMELTKSEEPKIRRFAMFNMAVASEMMGRPKAAKQWLEKSIEIKKTKKSENYLETIERQIVIYEVVDKQLGL